MSASGASVLLRSSARKGQALTAGIPGFGHGSATATKGEASARVSGRKRAVSPKNQMECAIISTRHIAIFAPMMNVHLMT
jgi:hypothetical protein